MMLDGVWVFRRVGLNLRKEVACKIACPYIVEGRFACKSKGRVICGTFLIRATARLF